MMSKFAYSCLLSTLLLLGACGGGSSSGGGDSNGVTEGASDAVSDSTGEAPGSDSDITGTYVGTGTVTASGGTFSETVTGPIQIRISEDNSVAFGAPGEPPVGTATLNANSDAFTISVPASFFNRSGIELTGALSASGSINGNTITGTITGSDVTFNGIEITITGDFNLEKT